MQTESDLNPSHPMSGFTAQFPNIDIESNETLLLVLSEDYSSFYTDITPDLFLFGEESESMIETESSSFGLSSNKLDDAAESIILFKWDGNAENSIEDVDYGYFRVSNYSISEWVWQRVCYRGVAWCFA
mgnify:CR=1 FL=1